MNKKNNTLNRNPLRQKEALFVTILLTVEVLFFVAVLTLFPNLALAIVGESVTVNTQLEVGTVSPEILNVSINNDDSGVDLTANATTPVIVNIIARDFNGEDDIINFTAHFFDSVTSSYGDADDNNHHYTNNSCFIDTAYGDQYEVNASCTFDVEYYANNATWNATVVATDNVSLTDQDSDLITINTLLAVGLPDSIDYGEVNATFVSSEQLANVTNFGNVFLNLSLEGYAVTQGDGLAMNCTLGAIKNISVNYEKYNLTISNSSALTPAEFESLYSNLTSSNVVRRFNLPYRLNDAAPYLDDTNATYWRIYVPTGVAGSCSGNIIFGATQAPGI